MAKRVMLVRGGVLGRNSGSGSVPGWEIDSICEYELSSRASPIQRLWKRWFSHPRAVKKAISKSVSKGSCDLVHITDQEQAHLIPKNSKLPVVVTVHDLFHLFPTKMKLGGQEIDKHYGLWLEIWNDLTQTAEKEYGYDKMIGEAKREELPFNAVEKRTLHIPLQFWVTIKPELERYV